jgi:CMP/dCMP kinase
VKKSDRTKHSHETSDTDMNGSINVTDNKTKHFQIAVDGPSGSGKSSLARVLAAHYGYIYIDTGAMYRAVGLYMYRSGINPRDGEAVAAVLPLISVNIAHINGIQQVFLCGEDISEAIRENIISSYASDVSSHPVVRAFLLGLQCDIAAKSRVVMDGRDIGTVIMPNADVKIFLTASDEVRAQRRFRELTAKGQDVTLEKVRSDMVQRDLSDSTRTAAPAIAAADAIILDNSLMTEAETLAAAVEIVEKSIKT